MDEDDRKSFNTWRELIKGRTDTPNPKRIQEMYSDIKDWGKWRDSPPKKMEVNWVDHGKKNKRGRRFSFFSNKKDDEGLER